MKKILKMAQLLVSVILLTCVACSDEREINTPGSGSGEYEVTFTVRLPSGFSDDTRGLISQDENIINELQVLAFGTDDHLFKTISYAKEVAGAPGVNEKKYVAKLRTGKFDLMVLANSNEYIDDFFPDEIIKDVTTRTSVIKKLQMTLLGKWNTDSKSVGYKAIPMWGVKKGVQVSSQTDLTGDEAFDVTRMLAKINVNVELEAGHKGTFDLESIRYYNRRTKGQLIPNEWEGGNAYVQAPSLVNNDIGVEDPLLYDSDCIDQKATCENEIYVLEAPAGSKNEHPKYPCIVVGGEYNGKLGYYRIDFANKENSTVNYIPILRNHIYSIIITKVEGAGFTDHEDAYNSLPVNIEADVIDWNLSTIGDIYFDGQNYLSIEKGRYELSWKAYQSKTAENTVKIKTDHRDGWKVEKIEYVGTDTGWLSLKDTDSGDKDEDSERWLDLKANSTKQTREAVITIAVSRIRGKIVVQQAPAPDLDLIIRDKDGNVVADGSTITYKSDNWTSRACEYTLEWFPPDATLRSTLINPVGGFKEMEFDEDDNMLKTENVSNATGEYAFDFVIKPFDTSDIKQRGDINLALKSAIKYQLAVDDGQGGTVTKNFTIINELLDVQTTKLGACKQGRIYDFEVEYNTPWELILDGENRIMDSRTLETLPADGGLEGKQGKRTIRFRLEIGKEYDGKEANFSFVKPGMGSTNTFDKVEVKSLYNHPNSYIIPPGTSFKFPIVKAYRVWESELIGQGLQGGANDLEVKVLWEDRTNVPIINTVSIQRNIQSPEASEVTVVAGAEGNALVALFLNNEIVWSWHLWITGYNPETDYKWYNNSGIITQLMTRNLGAWYEGMGDIRNCGLYYQWGRKDPFPGPVNLDANGSTLGSGGNVGLKWDENFPEYYVGTHTAPSSGNLVESIQYPNRFFKSGSAPYDWYTNSTAGYNNELWTDFDQLKADLDPCPDGWRIGNRFWINAKYYFTWAFSPVNGIDGKGWDYNSGDAPVGMYPASGYIDYATGNYLLMKQECLLWYGCHDVGQTGIDGEGVPRPEDKASGLVDRTYFYVGQGWVNKRARDRFPKANGVPVRCEKDEERYKPHW